MTAGLHSLAWKLLSSEPVFRVVDRWSTLPRKIGVSFALNELSGACRQLTADLGRVPQISRHLEKQFLGFQNTLERLSNASRDLIHHGQNVVNLASGQETGDVSLEAVFQVLEGPLAYLGAAHTAMEELVSGLRNCLAAISRLRDIQQTLETILAPLQITQVMFRIESAQLPSESMQVFSAVTEKIGMLQRQVQSAFSEHARVLGEVHANLVGVIETLETQLKTQGQRAFERRRDLSRFLATLSDDLARNAKRDVALTAASQQLAQLVSKAVMALQMQDIIAQKLAHGADGIRDILGALRGCSPAGAESCFRKVVALSRIEAAQLDAVVAELHSCDRSLRESFEGISNLLEQLNSDCLMLKEFSEITASTNGTVQGLLDGLAEIRQMISDTLATTTLAEQSVLAIRTATEGLNTAVDSVAQEMRLIALNAQIQAIQRGEGTGLDVLAAHSAEVSKSITTISFDISSKVVEVAHSVGEHSDRVRELRQAGQQQQQGINEAGAVQEAALHRFRDHTLTEFTATGVALDAARELGKGILSLLDLGEAVASIEKLRDSVRQLQERSEAVGRGFQHGDEAPLELADVQKRYTMESERLVHARANAAGTATPVAAAAEGEAALGQDVELWGDEAPASAGEAGELAPVAAGGDEAPGEFGAGVDLF